MISRTLVSCRRASVCAWTLGVLLYLVALLSLSATPASAAACLNESRRWESNTSPATGQAYSVGLPDCRAYEMVSPLDKQVHSAKPVPGPGLLAAPDPEGGVGAAGWASEGDFANPENYYANVFFPVNTYLSRRGASGWLTSSAFAPAKIVNAPGVDGLFTDLSPDLRSVQAGCGLNVVGLGESPTGGGGQGVVCAMRQGEGEWVHTPTYGTAANTSLQSVIHYMGGSVDLSRVFMQVGESLLPEDTLKSSSTGIYEFSGIGTVSPVLRIVNVASNGSELASRSSTGDAEGPLLGDRRPSPEVDGSAYHAISEDGKTVFFTATPTAKQEPAGEKQTVYARIDASKTVPVSNPSPPECTRTKLQEEEVEAKTAGVGCHSLRPATFQGASADGSKVFFTTDQQLVSADKDASTDLYMYDFTKPENERLTQISAGVSGENADVAGVVRTSSDGSRVYFVAEGVLTTAANKKGESAKLGKQNLYGYDTTVPGGETKFVARVADKSEVAGGTAISTDATDNTTHHQRFAQTTPDGRYLAFSTSAQLAGDTNCPEALKCPKAAYLYNFENGELTWISQASPALKAERTRRGKSPDPNEGKNAYVSPLPGSIAGAEADINDWDRAISGESEVEAPGKTPQERHDGEYVIFTTSEKLQENDENKALDVYEWHAGGAALVSDGHDAKGVDTGLEVEGEPVSAMSASGSDIFFLTHARLVGQDTDALADVYVARVGGGFPAPTEPSCSGSACQGRATALPSFGAAASSSYTGGQNVSPGAISVASSKASKPKPLTRAQQLAKALKACRGKPRKKRAGCEAQARRRYRASSSAKGGRRSR